ncbi:MAG TPA: hypothetical protein ENJ82_15480 [Bacteroidetes bacterium]|nr:hypothetical protein [Bacteroidota bacterium]
MESFEYFTLARVLHILAVVLWIGGVAMVTTVIIPAIKRISSKADRIKTFEQIEGRFALQAKVTTLITGLTGFYMLYKLDAWERYLDHRYWWLHTMTILWVIFTVLLYILEPFVLHKIFKKYAEKNPEKAFAIMHWAHWMLLLLSLITIAGAVAGSHGWLLK